MLPVRVKAVSSSSCTLPEASALLQRFLSSDACSDSFAGGYVVNVARALEELMPSKAESFEARAKERNHRLFPASHQNFEHSDEKQSLPVADNVGLAMEAGSAVMQEEKASKKHRKKRKHSLLDNAPDMVAQEPMAGPSFDEQKRHDKKRSKKEEQVGEAEDMDAHKASEKRVCAASLSVEVERDTEYAKRGRNKEKSVVENMDAHKTSEFKVSVAPLSVKVEEGVAVASSKKRRKKEKTGFLETPDKVLLPDNNGEAADLQASKEEPMAGPSFDEQKRHDKKRSKKEEQVGEAEDVDAHKASEKRVCAASLSVEVERDTEYAKRGRNKEKSVVENMDAHKTSEFKVSVAPLSVKVEAGVASSKKRRKKEKTDFLETPDKVLLPDNNGEAADLQASPSDFSSLATEKKKKRKKKQGFDDSARKTLSY